MKAAAALSIKHSTKGRIRNVLLELDNRFLRKSLAQLQYNEASSLSMYPIGCLDRPLQRLFSNDNQKLDTHIYKYKDDCPSANLSTKLLRLGP